jgi:hypothetical protein
MPADFNPKIWWLQLGLNDLGRTQCSEEVVVFGILRIVEEILVRKPEARIVINSLLPMSVLRLGIMPGAKDFQDSFTIPVGAQGTTRAVSPRPAQTDGKKNGRHGKNKKNTPADSGPEARRSMRIRTKDEADTDTNDTKKTGRKKKTRREKRDGRRERNKRKEDDDEISKPKRIRGFFKGKESLKMSSTPKKQKKFTTLTHRQRKIPLWTSISAINEQLQQFCSKHERVSYFDATDIFAEATGEKGEWMIKRMMISERGHPTEAGYKEWERQIVEKATKVLA